jgi:acetyl-CoA carboxylase carboxyltransferase component
MHSEVSGVSHRVFANDIEAIASTRKLMSFLPQNSSVKRTAKPWTDEDSQN